MLAGVVAVPTLRMLCAVAAQVIRLGTFEIWSRVEMPRRTGLFWGYTIPIGACFLYYWLYTIVMVECTIHLKAVIHGEVKWTFRQVTIQFFVVCDTSLD